MHISALARELNISVPVCQRHVSLLEKAGSIEKKSAGSSHIFSIKKEPLEKLKRVMNLLDEPHIIKVKKGKELASALKKVPGIKIEQTKEGAFIKSVDENEGNFI